MTRTARIRFLPSARETTVPLGIHLTAAALRAGVAIIHDCDGQGVCGTCRVRIEAGAGHLGPVGDSERRQLGSAVADGWRLCCLLRVQGDVTLRVPEGMFPYPPELQRG